MSSLQDKGGEGAKELEEFHSDRMKVVQLDVCSDEQVNQAVEYIKDNLADSENGNQLLYSLTQIKGQCVCVHSQTLFPPSLTIFRRS